MTDRKKKVEKKGGRGVGAVAGFLVLGLIIFGIYRLTSAITRDFEVDIVGNGEGRSFVIEGTLTNKRRRNWVNVWATFNLYDKDGVHVGTCSSSNVSGIRPRESWRFVASCVHRAVDVEEVAGYELMRVRARWEPRW